jgi:TusA-related sulfurtransferase
LSENYFRKSSKNMEVIDLTGEPCPLNLVKFKYHFYNLKAFCCLVKNGEPVKGIVNFLQYKNANFKLEEKGDCTLIIVGSCV